MLVDQMLVDWLMIDRLMSRVPHFDRAWRRRSD